jgi:hypothetical protein
MEVTSVYELAGESDVILPRALEEGFIAFVSASGMPFSPQVSWEGERSRIHFLFLNKDIRDLVEEFLLTFEPDEFHALEMAVPNDRVKHAERIAHESGWKSFIRQQGADRTRICFIRTPRSIPATELEERVDLVS